MNLNCDKNLAILVFLASYGICKVVCLETEFYNETVKRGQDVHLNIVRIGVTNFYSLYCQIQGEKDPNPASVAFYDKKTQQLMPTTNSYLNRTNLNNKSITLTQVRFDDENLAFQCIILSLIDGSPNFIYGTKHRIRSVQEAPSTYGTKLQEIYQFHEKSNIQLNCSFIGRPLQNSTWSGQLMQIGKQSVDEKKNGIYLSELTLKLTISNLQPIHLGYEGLCSTRNSFGIAEQKTKLNVTFAPKNTSLKISPLSPKEGLVIKMKCTSEANPSVSKYEFYKNNTLIGTSISGMYNFTSTNCSSDSGVYKCVPSNAYGNDSVSKEEINIYGSPNVTIPNPKVLVDELQNITLTCNVVGCPPPKIKWVLKGSQTILSSESKLTLYRSTSKTSGVYECIAYNQRENASSSVEVVVQYRPKNTSLEVVTKNPREGIVIQLRCTTDAYPSISYYLFEKGGKVVQNSSSNHYTFSSKDCRKEGGTYKCIPFNMMGSNSTDTTVVSIYGPPMPHISTPMVKVNESNNITLMCHVKGCPTPNITWYKMGNLNKVLSSQAQLALVNVHPVDQGVYYCFGSNRKENRSSESKVIVNFSPRNLQIKTNIPDGSYLKEGDTLTVNCTSDGYPKANYIFYQNDNILNQTSSGVLSIDNTDCVKHSGSYGCSAYNFRGKSKVKNTTVKIEGPPKVITSPKSKTINETDNATFLCNATGCPLPEIGWYKAGKLIMTGKKLEVKKGKISDDGNYICRSNNTRGTTDKKFILTVQFKPRQTQLTTKSKVYMAGSKVEIICKGNGKPKPMYSFHKRTPKSTASPVTSEDSLKKGILVIEKIDYGNSYKHIYGCTPWNLLGPGKMEETILNVEVKPTGQTITPSENPLVREEGQTLTLKCGVRAANPEATIEWKKEGSNEVLSSAENLMFSKLKKNDTGSYSCSATNKHGILVKKISVNVTYGPIISSMVKDEFYVCIDTKILLKCGGTGNPMPTARIKQGTKILASGITSIDYSLTVTNERYGNYTCELSNNVGTVKKPITLKKRKRPGTPIGTTIKPVDNTLEISWKVPKCSGQEGVASFVIYYRGKKDKEEKKVAFNCKTSTCQFTIRNLDENTIYSVSVVAVDTKGREGTKHYVQGVKTKAAISPKKNGKLSGTAVTFIIIGGIVIFLLAVALFVMVRKRSTGEGDIPKSSENQSQRKSSPKVELANKLENLAYQSDYDVEENRANGLHPNTGNGLGNPTYFGDDDKDAGNIPSEDVIEEGENEEAEEGENEEAAEEERQDGPSNTQRADTSKDNVDKEKTSYEMDKISEPEKENDHIYTEIHKADV